MYTVDEVEDMLADRMAAVTTPPMRPGELEALLRRLLPTVLVPTPPPSPDTHGNGDFATAPTVGSTDTEAGTTASDWYYGMETLLQHLLPGTPVPVSRPRPAPVRRDWTTIVCFSCGKSGHGVGRCP